MTHLTREAGLCIEGRQQGLPILARVYLGGGGEVQGGEEGGALVAHLRRGKTNILRWVFNSKNEFNKGRQKKFQLKNV